MSDLLAVPNLLMRLDRSRIDAGVYQHCLEAENLRQHNNLQQAIDLACAATQLAANIEQPLAIGIAFLYLANLRASSSIDSDHKLAVLDCDTAIEWLKRDEHHWLLAVLSKARILLDNARELEAMEHYQQAEQLLGRLAARDRRQSRPDDRRNYRDLQRAVINTLRYIRLEGSQHGQQAEPTPNPVTKALTVPLRVMWPEGNPVGFGLIPPPRGIAPDRIEITRVWIEGQAYAIHPIEADSNRSQSFQLRPGQPYVALRVMTEDRWVLVRRTDWLDQSPQYVLLVDPTGQQAWVDDVESDTNSFYVIGRDRRWQARDGDESPESTDNAPRIVGVVEALLIPVPIQKDSA